MPATQFYVLSDDNPGPGGFGAEHGLSHLIILGDGRQWLWDAGQSRLFLDSASMLGLDISATRGVALSHGHYDHTDGLSALLEQTRFKGPIFAHPSFSIERYKRTPESAPKHIGFNSKRLPAPLPGFVPVYNRCDLDEGLTMFTDIPRREGLFESTAGFSFDVAGKEHDSVQDDACLALQTGSGPVLVLGCCHSGLGNTLHHVSRAMRIDAFHAVTGGLHLMNATEEVLKQTVEVCREFCVERLYPCHCTGKEAVSYLRKNLPGSVFDIGTGSAIEF